MNRNRETTQPLDSGNNDFVINSLWLIGFIEGDGTFGIKNSSPYFQIAQKITNQGTLNAIKIYISKLTNVNVKTSVTNVTSALNQKTGVVSLVVNNIDSLYYNILPFLDGSKMYTRKVIDFKLWRISLIIHKLGYYYLPEGRQLFTDISKNINKFRYTTSNTNQNSISLTEIIKRSNDLFAIQPPFDINSGKNHKELAQEFSRANDKTRIYS